MSIQISTWRRQLQITGEDRHPIVLRFLASIPMLGIGLMHVFDPETPMRPLVEAAGLPAAGLLSPAAVAAEIVAGVLLLIGFYTRLGAVLAIFTMVVAAYAHLVIDVWPNGANNEPPILLPLAVLVCAAYVLWRGAGRWSLDHLMGRGNAAGS